MISFLETSSFYFMFALRFAAYALAALFYLSYFFGRKQESQVRDYIFAFEKISGSIVKNAFK